MGTQYTQRLHTTRKYIFNKAPRRKTIRPSIVQENVLLPHGSNQIYELQKLRPLFPLQKAYTNQRRSDSCYNWILRSQNIRLRKKYLEQAKAKENQEKP